MHRRRIALEGNGGTLAAYVERSRAAARTRRWGAATWLPLSTQIERRQAVAVAQQSTHDHAGPVRAGRRGGGALEPPPVAEVRTSRTSAAAVTAFVSGLAAAMAALFSLTSGLALLLGLVATVAGVVGMNVTSRPHITGRVLVPIGVLCGLIALVLVSLRYAQVHGAFADGALPRRRWNAPAAQYRPEDPVAEDATDCEEQPEELARIWRERTCSAADAELGEGSVHRFERAPDATATRGLTYPERRVRARRARTRSGCDAARAPTRTSRLPMRWP